MAGTLLPDMPMSDRAANQGFDGVTSPKAFTAFNFCCSALYIPTCTLLYYEKASVY